MQRAEVADGVENMNVKAWGENLNEGHFGTPSKRTTPNIFFETPSPERLRESGAPRNTGNLARAFTTDFAFVSEPSNERLDALAMKKLKVNGSVPFSRKRGPLRYQRQLQKNKLNQLIQETQARKAQARAEGNEEELAKINKELRENLKEQNKASRGASRRRQRSRGGKNQRKKKLQRSPRRKSHNRRRSTRRKSPNRRRSARGGKRSARNRRRRARSPRRKLAGKEFNSIRKYLDNMPTPLKVAFPGYVIYHIATDKEAFF